MRIGDGHGFEELQKDNMNPPLTASTAESQNEAFFCNL
jgi:hypothetical protein